MGSCPPDTGVLEVKICGVIEKTKAGYAPFLLEMAHSRQVPGIAPANHEVGQVEPFSWRRRDISSFGFRLDINSASALAYSHCQIDMLMNAHELLIQRTKSLKDIGAHQHAVKLHVIARTSFQRSRQLGNRCIRKTMLIVKYSFALVSHHIEGAAGHVYRLQFRLAYKIEWPHDPGARLLGAANERLQPTRRDQNVVFQENDIFAFHVLQSTIPRLVRR